MRLFAVALVLCLALACSGPEVKSGVRLRSGPASKLWRPRLVLLFFPKVISGAVDIDLKLGSRPHMASEMAAIVHVNCRKHLEGERMPRLLDAAEDTRKKNRLALLGTVIHRVHRKTGRPPAGIVSELRRATSADGALVVEVFRFGASARKLELKSASGEVASARRMEPSPSGWLNCGVRLLLIKTSTAEVAWEASYLESRPKTDGLTQESLARDCVARLFESFPYRRK